MIEPSPRCEHAEAHGYVVGNATPDVLCFEEPLLVEAGDLQFGPWIGVVNRFRDLLALAATQSDVALRR